VTDDQILNFSRMLMPVSKFTICTTMRQVAGRLQTTPTPIIPRCPAESVPAFVHPDHAYEAAYLFSGEIS
jgi:hypothetical protein